MFSRGDNIFTPYYNVLQVSHRLLKHVRIQQQRVPSRLNRLSQGRSRFVRLETV